ncbi:hypothetical protein TRIATDRAFT_45696 [Trichoderma atroviride IMI 206040]|uniref:Uncharacterized protein n=1 Tax=Hypocrea atroviridis (strain ATCC 20476 / IMI 206040) TaxID=452589 RepID=G9NQM3_HYPAI|nr:uncharacterized protein TRIATDRAFT_45696 [Trichoderma atroviride IMI 206040]EHK46846.1 hypothetical protein TRIATDRAFT_45696 [Trichoderma atroviride IMI 206040]
MSQLLNDDSIIIAPPPWTLKVDVYTAPFWISASQARNFPFDIAYSPLELSSEFSDLGSSRPVGGFGGIQVIRYKETPVGPYDELVIIPGKFEWTKQDSNDERTSGHSYKATRLYVSQKHTCFNGRTNWNIPKHLARFDWEEAPDKSLTVRVYPHDTFSYKTEATASPIPFFQATMKRVPIIPSFPFSSKWLSLVGVNLECVHPPLPEGRGSQGELPGTESWCAFTPAFSGKAVSLMTFDMKQSRADDKMVSQRNKNFWPGLGRRRVGIMMENATLVLDSREF